MRYLVGFLWVLALGCGDAGIPDPCRDVVCDDNDACTNDWCFQGECEHAPVVCNDRNVCTHDSCDSVSGCETTPVDDGTPCGDRARVCEAGTCVGDFACTEQGIRDAIAEGGGPHTFECERSTTVSTSETIFISRSVILDGEDNLIVDGNDHHRVFNVIGRAVTLRRMTITGGRVETSNGGGISNGGTLTLDHVTVSDNTATYSGSSLFRGTGGGIYNTGTLTLTDSTVSGNVASWDGRGDHCGLLWYVPCGGHGGGIENEAGSVTLTRTTVDGNRATERGGGIENSDGGTLVLTNSTVSGNTGGGIYDFSSTAVVTLTHVTLSQNTPYAIAGFGSGGTRTLMNSLVLGARCSNVLSGGYNIESPGDTCGFDQATDQVDITAAELNLGPLQDNGGPTETHALGAGSLAIDVIPEAECVDADGAPLTTDQRGEPRDSMCDVGAFEVQP